MTSENLYQTFVSKHFDFLNEEVCNPTMDRSLAHYTHAQDSIHEMFHITDAPDFGGGDDDDGPMTSFDGHHLPVENEVRTNENIASSRFLRET